MEPDTAGFREAQDSLIEKMGQSVVLLTPLPTVWPVGTKLDIETGRPLDPWVQPTSSGFASAFASASVSSRPLIQTDEARLEQAPLGVKRTAGVALILRVEDRAKASGATDAIVDDLSYKVEDVTYDHGRILVFLEPH